MQRVGIERRAGLTAAQFEREFLSGEGRPVIATDALAQWPALQRWSLAWFGERYGSDLVSVSQGLFSTAARVTKLRAYLDHLQHGGEFPGIWVDAASRRPLSEPPPPCPHPPYLLAWRAFHKHPELLADVEPRPAFLADWTSALSPPLRAAFEATLERESTEVFIGPADTVSRLHQDYEGTHAWLAQVQGRKRVALVAPDAGARLMAAGCDPVSLDVPDPGGVADVLVHEGEIGPGDLLFVPSYWWHWVRSLDTAITVSHNFFNQANVGDYLAGLLRHQERLARCLGELPG